MGEVRDDVGGVAHQADAGLLAQRLVAAGGQQGGDWTRHGHGRSAQASRMLGRWQIVIGGQATETQVAYPAAAEARELACPRSLGTSQVSGLSGTAGDFLTLRQAAEA